MSRLEDLGARVAAEQDRTLDGSTDLARARCGLANGRVVKPARRHRPWIAVAATLALAVAGAFLLLLRAGVPDRAPRQVATWRPGDRITAPGNAALPIRFADGSVVQIDPRAEACVQSFDASGARLSVASGGALVDVVHRPGRQWLLEVGPFSIHVTGTRFRVDWDPAAGTFRLQMERGSVLVEGPMLSSGRSLEAGEILSVWTAERRVEVLATGAARVADAAPPAPPSGVPALFPAPAAPPPPAPAASCPSGPPAVAAAPPPSATTGSGIATATCPRRTGPAAGANSWFPPAPSSVPAAGSGATTALVSPVAPAETTARSDAWRSYANEGRYAEAVAAAESAGFDGIIASATADDLLTLGDAARFAGQTDRGETAYREVRRRFPGTREAGLAAFSLGRLAFDAHADFAGAARWFEACLQEPDAGGVAREALGRLVESLDRAGQPAAAAAAAGRYLERYPTGPYADYAHTLLRRGVVPP